MYLKSLTLQNFKNHSLSKFNFSNKVICFVGKNGSGKTNILDSIHYLSLTKSYFNHVDSLNVKFDEDYFIEFKNTGTKLYFEPGYAYHWNTYNVHRFNFNYHDKIKNRTCIVLGWSPWLDFDGESWVKNEYCNKIHPTDMVKQGLVI